MILGRALLLALLLSTSLHAGDDRGNGGAGIICKQEAGKIQSVTVLDIYEATIRFGADYRVALGPAQLDPVKKALYALDRLVRFSPLKSDRYRQMILNFMKETYFLPPGNRLVEIPDADNISIPAGCELGQLAVQRPPEFPQDHYYTIDTDLWTAMDLDNQAALILHEVFYRDGIAVGHKNSRKARYFNSMVMSERLKPFTLENYLELLLLVNLPEFDYLGFELVAKPIGDTRSFAFYENEPWKLGFAFINELRPHPKYYFNRTLHFASDLSRVAGTIAKPFYPNGPSGICLTSELGGVMKPMPLVVDLKRGETLGLLCRPFASILDGVKVEWSGYIGFDSKNITLGCSENRESLGALANRYLDLDIRDGNLVSAGDIGVPQCDNYMALLSAGVLFPFPCQ